MTNASESLNMSLRKVIKTRGSSPNAHAALKVLYLALGHIAKKWTMPVQEETEYTNHRALIPGPSIELGQDFRTNPKKTSRN
jgi:putative transposase